MQSDSAHPPATKSAAMRWLIGGVLGYLVLVGLMAAFETALVFPAPRIERAQLTRAAGVFGATEVALTAADGTVLYGWRIGETDRLVLYFSGNGSSVGEGDLYRQLSTAGISTLHVNYRGYPGSEGSPSEEGLLRDARAAWNEARRTHPADRIIVLGKSLGGGVATGLVAGLAEEQPAGLVLASTFTSAVTVGAETYPWLPVSTLMRNRFDSLAKADQIRCPTLVLHGTADTMIGPHHGQRLAEAITDAVFLGVSGMGHNDRLLNNPEAWAAFERLIH